jgi:hypothetical protein
LDFANHPYLCKGLFKSILITTFSIAGLRLSLKNRQVGEKWVSDDCSYLCKGLLKEYSDFTCFIALSKTVFCFCARKIMA